ncbi:MAG TPA: hypothetical protein VLL50_14065 [Usitatibacter sp.]|nr:hypothetical protein [Usitatibacter sp.]
MLRQPSAGIHPLPAATTSASAPDTSIAVRYPVTVSALAIPRCSGAATSVRNASKTISCDADVNATATATNAMTARSSRGESDPIAAMSTASRTWVTRSHPRRRPRNGGTNRSMVGDHRNFHVYGIPTSVKMPMVDRSTPSTVIQAWSVVPVSASGSPEEKASSRIAARLRSRRASR